MCQEIQECRAALEKECVSLSAHLLSLRVIELHAGVTGSSQQLYETERAEPPDAQESPAQRRRVILTDVLGEASFSLNSIRYVIDSGVQLKTVSPSSECVSVLSYEARSSSFCSSTDLQSSDPSGFTASAAHQQTAGGHTRPQGQQHTARCVTQQSCTAQIQ